MKHGHAQRGRWSDTYKSWRYMRDRVARDPDYAGVTICSRWNSFANFLADMGEKPEGKTLDRIKNSLGYSPDNCRWATINEQMNNTTMNRIVEFSGRQQTLAQWAKELNIPYKTLFSRVNQYGWSVKEAFTRPIRRWA